MDILKTQDRPLFGPDVIFQFKIWIKIDKPFQIRCRENVLEIPSVFVVTEIFSL